MSYDPNSIDAMFSKVLQKLENQDMVLDEIKRQTIKTNGRVSALEFWRQDITIRIGTIATVATFIANAVLMFLGKYLH